MVYNDTIETLDMAGRLVGYASGSRYQMRGDFLFEGVPLVDAHVLEIGCGSGAWAIWAALHGARRVIGIEPEAEGSTQGTLENMRRSITALGLRGRVEARAEFLHDLPMPDDPYDLVIMFNVINHLDEESVVALHKDRDAYDRYVARLKDLRRRMRTGGWLIVADCGRDNFWPRLGMPSPFVPSIEWHKHQNPALWIDVFREAGFVHVDLRWSPLQPFPRLTSNRFVQYLTCSHFVLRLQAV